MMINKKRLLFSAIVAVVLTSQHNSMVYAQTSIAKDVCNGLLTVSQEVFSLSWQATKFFVTQAYNGSCIAYELGKPCIIAGADSLQKMVAELYAKYAATHSQSESSKLSENSVDTTQNDETHEVVVAEELPDCPICFEKEELFSYCSNHDDHRFCRGCIEDIIQHDSDATCSLCRQAFKQNMIEDIKHEREHRSCVYCKGPASEFEDLNPIFLYNTRIVAHGTCHASNKDKHALNFGY